MYGSTSVSCQLYIIIPDKTSLGVHQGLLRIDPLPFQYYTTIKVLEASILYHVHPQLFAIEQFGNYLAPCRQLQSQKCSYHWLHVYRWDGTIKFIKSTVHWKSIIVTIEVFIIMATRISEVAIDIEGAAADMLATVTTSVLKYHVWLHGSCCLLNGSEMIVTCMHLLTSTHHASLQLSQQTQTSG